MNNVLKSLSVVFLLLIVLSIHPTQAKVSLSNNEVAIATMVSEANVDQPNKKISKQARLEEKKRKKLARKQKRLQRFLKSKVGKWLLKRSIKKAQRRHKRLERKKKRWLAKGKDITKLEKKQRRGNVRTGLLLIIIGALFFFFLGSLSPFDIIGIVVAAIGLLLVLLYLLT